MKVFTETQRFDQWWFRALMLVAACIIVGSLFMAYPDIEKDIIQFIILFGISLLSILLLVAITFYFRLETRIDELGITYQFWPFTLRKKIIQWQTLKECYVRKYAPISEYGGWGYRGRLFKKSKAYNVKGNIGIQIVFKDDKRLLIGTQKESDVKKVLAEYVHKIAIK